MLPVRRWQVAEHYRIKRRAIGRRLGLDTARCPAGLAEGKFTMPQQIFGNLPIGIGILLQIARMAHRHAAANQQRNTSRPVSARPVSGNPISTQSDGCHSKVRAWS